MGYERMLKELSQSDKGLFVELGTEMLHAVLGCAAQSWDRSSSLPANWMWAKSLLFSCVFLVFLNLAAPDDMMKSQLVRLSPFQRQKGKMILTGRQVQNQELLLLFPQSQFPGRICYGC